MAIETPPKTLVCRDCGKRKRLDLFVNDKTCKWGKEKLCRACVKERRRQYYKQNAEAIKQHNKQYRKQNAEALKQYYKQNAEAIKQYNKQYKKQNAEAIKQYNKQYNKQYCKSKRQTCVQFRLREGVRRGLYRAIKYGGTKNQASLKYLGCSIEKLKQHLESQFQPGMTWDNWSHDGWHIDHTKPLASFDLTDEKQLRKACHYTNLQPMWAEENLSKGARYSGRKETQRRAS